MLPDSGDAEDASERVAGNVDDKGSWRCLPGT